MGLDLTLYAVNKDGVKVKLCYGRKTWSIYNFFKRSDNYIDEGLYKVTKNQWDHYIDTVDEYINTLRNMIDFLGTLDKADEELSQLIELRNSKSQEPINVEDDAICNAIKDSYDYAMITLEEVLNNIYDGDVSYTLGADWEARATVNWYDNDFDVCNAFLDGCEVFIDRSY